MLCCDPAEGHGRAERDAAAGVVAGHHGIHVVAAGVEAGDGPAVLVQHLGLRVDLEARERAQAAGLSAAMRRAIDTIEAGAAVGPALAALKTEILAGGFSAVDYADLRDATTLEELTAFDGRPARLLVAARIGPARLIDNMGLGD